MSTDAPLPRKWATPTRVVAALVFVVAVLALAVLVARWSTPRRITVRIAEPSGKTIVCHLVIDGRPEARESIVPVTYEFSANEVRFAVIAKHSHPPGRVHVQVHDRSGTGGSATDEGVTGSYAANLWNTSFHIAGMAHRHVESMRRSTLDEEGNQDDAPDPPP